MLERISWMISLSYLFWKSHSSCCLGGLGDGAHLNHAFINFVDRNSRDRNQSFKYKEQWRRRLTFSLTISSFFIVCCSFPKVLWLVSMSLTSCCFHSNWDVIMSTNKRKASTIGLVIIAGRSHITWKNNHYCIRIIIRGAGSESSEIRKKGKREENKWLQTWVSLFNNSIKTLYSKLWNNDRWQESNKIVRQPIVWFRCMIISD